MVMIVVMAMVVGTEKNRESRVVVVGAAVAMTFSSFLSSISLQVRLPSHHQHA
jgi:hypothetical protein